MSEECKATSEEKLMDFLMNPSEAKSEAEWFASRIIADLRTQLADMRASIQVASDGADKCQNIEVLRKYLLGLREQYPKGE